MPFKSEKQRKYLWANEPEIARDWTKTYGSKVKKADGGRIGFKDGSDYGQFSRAVSRAANNPTRSSVPDRGGNEGQFQRRIDQTAAKKQMAEREARDGILQSFKNFPDTMNRRGLKRNLDYYMSGKKLDFPMVMAALKGPQEEDDYYTQFAGMSPLELKAQYGNVLNDEEIARVQQMSGVLGQDKITRENFVDAFYGPKGPPQPNTGGDGGGLPYIYPYEMASAPIEEEEIEVADIGLGSGHFRVPEQYRLAEGGRVPAAFGGIMDTSTGRRGYFLGSVGKAISKPFKKAARQLRNLLQVHLEN